MLKRVFIAATVLAALASTTTYGGDISIENAWVRSAPPTATVLAGYMSIHNGSAEPRTLTSVSSPSFSSIELHRTTLHNGMMHMEAMKSLVIAPRETIRLEPNSYHLMLNNPKQRIKEGDTISFELSFNGEKEVVTAVVKRDNEGQDDSAKHHHH